jgi:alpha-beta hydrolase superfamily lysophospholipase
MTILLTVLAVYAAITLFMFLFQSHLLYFPHREIIGTPALLGLTFTDEEFRTSDGVLLHGWFVPAGSAAQTILFMHGNGGNISYLLETLAIAHRLGYNMYVFDYRGYGLSQGSPDEEGTYRDAMAAWTFLTSERGIPARTIILQGRSLGGAVAAWLATQRNPAGLVIESSFTSVPDIASDAYPFFPVRLLSRFRYPTIEYVREVRCPVLVIHSQDDEIVPYEHGTKLFEAAKEPKAFLKISGGHNEGFVLDEKRYREGIERFVRGVIGG